ncbi:MAG: CHRD domain-containing protein [Candidatus Eisenbacteria bacterium]|uniref:CHRD domain-containing protein n=1 Tax=Eiseniibacteriota bacterium TaxID=2212470 RepID=A0A538TRC7_UNCEI|nr:MAG: CHRD domain-containing protein [Candidatus Eisenbacteria bacterium]
MKKATLLLASLVVLALVGLRLAYANPMVSATLDGIAELAGGDPDGSGQVVINISPGSGEICYDLTVTGIEPATAAHIHHAPVGVNGPIVVALTAPSSGSSQDCVTIDKDLAKDILQHPEEYYVNVHNADYPAGAIRGQLSR